jgi:hypothetical protein
MRLPLNNFKTIGTSFLLKRKYHSANIHSGTGVKMMKNGPRHIMDAEDFEPLYVPQDNILEDCLRREAERVAHQENLMNRVVYDSVDPAPNHLAELANQ